MSGNRQQSETDALPEEACFRDILDAQIHIGPGKLEELLAQMDAVGDRAVVIDKYWTRNFTQEPHFGCLTSENAFRPKDRSKLRPHPSQLL